MVFATWEPASVIQATLGTRAPILVLKVGVVTSVMSPFATTTATVVDTVNCLVNANVSKALRVRIVS
jgi:hypothetical protein